MKQERIPIEEATQPQLSKFARINLGLDVDGRSGEEKLRSAIQSAMPGIKEIIVFDTDSVEAKKPAANSREAASFTKEDENGELIKDEDGNPRKFCKIIIPKEDKPGGDEPVPAGCNGRIMYIPRGEPVVVPMEFVESLDNAEMQVFEAYDGTGMGGLKAPQVVKRHQFQYVS